MTKGKYFELTSFYRKITYECFEKSLKNNGSSYNVDLSISGDSTDFILFCHL